MANMIERLTVIFRATLDAPDLVLTDELSARDVETWDSITNVDLIIAIEDEFHVELTTQEVSGMRNVGDLLRFLRSKGVQ